MGPNVKICINWQKKDGDFFNFFLWKVIQKELLFREEKHVMDNIQTDLK